MKSSAFTLLASMIATLFITPLVWAETTSANASAAAKDVSVFLLKQSSNIKLVKGIDGRNQLLDADKARGYTSCILISDNQAASSSLISSLREAAENAIEASLGIDRARANAHYGYAHVSYSDSSFFGCSGIGSRPDILVVEQDVLFGPAFTRTNLIPDIYSRIANIPGTEVATYYLAAEAKVKDAANEEAKRRQILEQDSDADNSPFGRATNYVAAITLTPAKELAGLKFCAQKFETKAEVSAANGAALQFSPGEDRTPSALFRRAISLNFQTKDYETLDKLYAAWQDNPSVCNVYVGSPKSARLLMKSIQRDKGRTLFVTAIYPTESMREVAAISEGFENYKMMEFATDIDASPEQIKSLAAYNIKTKDAFDEALSEMKAAHYSDKTSAYELLAYQNDKRASRNGQTALSIKQKREKKALADAQQEDDAFHKNFPYTATLSCEVNGSELPLLTCITTPVEFSNGNDYGTYSASQLATGSLQGCSFRRCEIPLKRSFEIKVQNGGNENQYVLSLSIRDSKTGRMIFQKSATQYGVIRARN